MSNEGYGTHSSDESELHAFETSFLRAHGPIPPAETCPIGWQASALTPVFWGVRDFDTSSGAPVALRVFFPSVDDESSAARFLAGCGRYPVIVFVHGHCLGDADHYRKWSRLPAQLARSGYVVVVPQLPSIGAHPSENNDARQAVLDTLEWIHGSWQHHNALLPPPATGLAGHSYGAIHAAYLATEIQVAAVASLSGEWGPSEWTQFGPPPLEGLTIPKLFTWGTGEEIGGAGGGGAFALSVSDWNALTKPKHRAIFANGTHWDYLYTSETPCDPLRGPCARLSGAAFDLLTMFFANYLPPEFWPNLPDRVPNTLIPPKLVLTSEQEPYAMGHLIGWKLFEEAEGCSVEIDQDLVTDRIVPYVRFDPALSAAQLVRAVGLVPEFIDATGPGERWVFSQSPGPGTKVSVGSTVTMRLRTGPIP